MAEDVTFQEVVWNISLGETLPYIENRLDQEYPADYWVDVAKSFAGIWIE